ncbi:MAG: putative sulfate transporter [Nitrospira sp.]|jgi:MFS superfamily sulfate permease-like transporter|nr:MAG: putative sulfate transporter [Nitrospira sp.]
MSSFEHLSGAQEEKPQNGIPGLKHWRYDLVAGVQVALVALPLSLGVALASGAAPITGVISAIIAGLVFPLFGGAYITISGPAAGLAPALLAGMLTLGQGDLEAGYPLVLVAICLTGAAQVLLSVYKVGRFAMYFPMSVLQGMLAAIGMLIIIKQIPSLLGHLTPSTKSIPEAITLIPAQIIGMNPAVFAVGSITLALLFGLDSNMVKNQRWARNIPAPLLVVALGGVAGWMLHFPDAYLIHVPKDVFAQGIHFPHFSEIWQRSELWFALLTTVVTLTLIDGTETLATIAAIDKIDPFHRKSDPNVTLRAMGMSNILSSLAGGLTIIPGGIKSTANVIAGGRTLWANFYCAIFMAIFVWFGTDLINRIPLTVLAGLLIFIGWRLCAPKIFLKVFSIGAEQLLVAVVCVAVTLYTSDILLGVIAGTVTKILVLCFDVVKALTVERQFHAGPTKSFSARVWTAFKELFGDPVIRIGDGRTHGASIPVMSVAAKNMKHPYKIYLSSLSCMNLMKLDAKLKALPNYRDNFMIILSGHVVDHTAMEYLHQFRDQHVKAGHHCVILGTQHFLSHSDHRLAYRVHYSDDAMAYG